MDSGMAFVAGEPEFIPMPSFVAGRDPVTIPISSSLMEPSYCKVKIPEYSELAHISLEEDAGPSKNNQCTIEEKSDASTTDTGESIPDFDEILSHISNYFTELDFAHTSHAESHFCGFFSNPSSKDMGEVLATLALPTTSKREQWWKLSKIQVTCPFTGFPIKFLPYPPFKLSVASTGSKMLVDGKSLALTMISTCDFVNGWCTDAFEVVALGDYIRKCKLGRLHPDHAMALANSINSPDRSGAEQAKALRELNRMIASAKAELEKLNRIREQRLLRLYQELKRDAASLDVGRKDFNFRKTSVASNSP
jgi:hypothetical protein